MLSVQRVSKRFGSVQALDGVSIEFAPGEIHAVLGENGAGKSTLMGVLGGFVVPDEGSVSKNGAPMPVGRPFDARRAGVAMVHQHFTLVPAFTVAENLCLGQTESLLRTHDAGRGADIPLAIARSLGWQLEAGARIDDLPVGTQQRVEILKALSSEGDVLIFDEPTAVLTPAEVDDLFRVMRDLASRGKTVLLIAHKLSEVLAVANRVSVLRHGKLVAAASRSEVDADILAEWMVGERLSPATVFESTTGRQDIILRVSGVYARGDRGEPAVRGVDLEIAAGEIVGLGGVDGNGQVEFAEVLAGVRQVEQGRVIVEQGSGEGKRAYIPQDRHGDGLALSLSLTDNLLIEGHQDSRLRKGPIFKPKAVRDWAQSLVERFDIRTSNLAEPVSSLSGGNQQKVVVARNLDVRPTLLVAVNPTRGLDIKATRFVHSQIRDAARAGSAVALFSTDHDELVEVADRIVYLSRGELVKSVGGEA